MKPLKHPVFITIITLFSVLFIAILTWWMIFVISNFRTLGTLATPPNVVATPNQAGADALMAPKD